MLFLKICLSAFSISSRPQRCSIFLEKKWKHYLLSGLEYCMHIKKRNIYINRGGDCSGSTVLLQFRAVYLKKNNDDNNKNIARSDPMAFIQEQYSNQCQHILE